jgi:hypothetical protein
MGGCEPGGRVEAKEISPIRQPDFIQLFVVMSLYLGTFVLMSRGKISRYYGYHFTKDESGIMVTMHGNRHIHVRNNFGN